MCTDGGAETFDLVVFSRYEVTERASYLGGDEGVDRGCNLEVARPRYRGGLGRREGVG